MEEFLYSIIVLDGSGNVNMSQRYSAFVGIFPANRKTSMDLQLTVFSQCSHVLAFQSCVP